MDASGLVLEGGKVYALAFTTIPNSSMVNALLIPYAVSPSKLSNTVAATRVIAALPRSSTVGASINGQVYLPEVGSPAISPYLPVKAESAPSLSWTVDGQSRPPTPLEVKIGGRYSVLVWGNSNAPQVTSILESTTTPPNGSAKLRILNAVAGLGPVSLSLNLAPVVNGIAPGQLIETTLSNVVDEQQLSIRAGATTVFSQPKRFIAGATYTIYLTGAPGMVEAQLVQH
jgi:hypothetical protein